MVAMQTVEYGSRATHRSKYTAYANNLGIRIFSLPRLTHELFVHIQYTSYMETCLYSVQWRHCIHDKQPRCENELNQKTSKSTFRAQNVKGQGHSRSTRSTKVKFSGQNRLYVMYIKLKWSQTVQ